MKVIIFALSLLSCFFTLSVNAAPSLQHQVFDKNLQKIDLSQYKGQVVYLDFWASWCAPCRTSFPWMNAMHNKYQQQGLAVVAINLDHDPAAAAQFLADLNPQFDIFYNPDGDVAQAFDLMGMPSSYLFNRAGLLVQKHVGFFNRHTFVYENELQQLLQESK